MAASVVTTERFAQGLTFKDFITQVKVNKDKFEQYYGTAKLSPEDMEFFRRAVKALNGVAKVLVLGEDWCPDVIRGLPMVARLAEATGIELRVFFRDKNLDIMNEFLNKGQFMSIPVVVFYTKDQQYLGHWIERPEAANRERAEIEEKAKKEMPNASEQDIRNIVRDRTQARYPAWQQESIKEMRQMLSKKLEL